MSDIDENQSVNVVTPLELNGITASELVEQVKGVVFSVGFSEIVAQEEALRHDILSGEGTSQMVVEAQTQPLIVTPRAELGEDSSGHTAGTSGTSVSRRRQRSTAALGKKSTAIRKVGNSKHRRISTSNISGAVVSSMGGVIGSVIEDSTQDDPHVQARTSINNESYDGEMISPAPQLNANANSNHHLIDVIESVVSQSANMFDNHVVTNEIVLTNNDDSSGQITTQASNQSINLVTEELPQPESSNRRANNTINLDDTCIDLTNDDDVYHINDDNDDCIMITDIIDNTEALRSSQEPLFTSGLPGASEITTTVPHMLQRPNPRQYARRGRAAGLIRVRQGLVRSQAQAQAQALERSFSSINRPYHQENDVMVMDLTGHPNHSPPPTSVSRRIRCPICLEEDDQISKSGRKLVSTHCGHIFCDTCISQSLKQNKICPQCRKKLSPKQVHPIYI